MSNFFTKSRLFSFLTIVALNTSLIASDCCETYTPCSRTYIGGFGGGLYSDTTRVTQLGTAFFPEAAGGPLAVSAHGNTSKTSSGFGGVQIGHEWDIGSSWGLVPAVEAEAFWFNHKKRGHLINVSDRLPEHDFLDTFKMDMGVYLANVVVSVNNSFFNDYSLTPYVGGGIGASRISIKNASSLQTDPLEVGINHFNSGRSDTSWAFAAQAKVGLRYNFCGSFHIFGEYRYLFVDTTNYIFGSTDYPTHAATSPWNVKIKNIQYNAFVFGIQYDL